MKTLTPAQIHALAIKAGFNSTTAITATAIALAESGGRPDAIGDINVPTPGSKSVGLFQINWTPQMNKVAWRDPKANLDPLTNTQSAYTISNHGTNFSPWTTYKTGAYRRFLATVEAAIAAPKVKPSGPVSPAPITPPAAPEPVVVYAEFLALQQELSVAKAAIKILLKLATQ